MLDSALKSTLPTIEFIPARELKVGSKLLLFNSACAIIEKIELEKLEKPEITYNFEVADFHTYYVTESNVLVYNDCDETSLYRAMSNDEYGSLTKHGRFKHKLGTMQEKWMATNYDDAVAWGKRLNGDGNFRVVEIRVPTNSLKGMFYANHALDGIGKAYCAHYKYLNNIMLGFMRLL